MAILKCKMCGGDLEVINGTAVAECEYCGSKQTVPNADNEKKMTLFSRANRLRMGCDFDKAAGVYENIVAEFPEEAEAYWGLVLCKYGIEYVDDPATGRKVPTCHRSSFESVMDDNNFDQTLENADPIARSVYREEAKQIEEIRKGIIAVSAKEQPYDIFICYKETAPDGNRTIDSVMAQDVYDALNAKGYRVFFSRITLEEKLGVEYEPYIFAALNSAKVMLVFGTDYEYFNAVWVKNEWSRYLKLMTADKEKHLIPCFKDIDAYDMPKEFSRLQAQDMGKIGWTQDLIRGIEKLLPLKSEPVTVSAPAGNTATTDTLLKRAFMFLEDGEWSKADEKCENVLDIDPENALAYLGKLMIDLRKNLREQLGKSRVSFEENKNYIKVIRFGSPALKAEVQGYLEEAKARAASTPAPAPAPATELGSYSVYVSARGTSSLSLVKAIREITGFGLKEAKDMVDSFPGYFAKDVSYEQAEIIKKNLTSAGATVEIRGTSPVVTYSSSSYSVYAKAFHPNYKLQAIKIIREATGLGLKDAKDFVEGGPDYVVKDVSYEEAMKLKKLLEEAKATVEIK